MKHVLLLDTETTGTDDSAVCIEVAVALFSVPCAGIVRAFSSLIEATENPAEAVNGISQALLAGAPPPGNVWASCERFARDAEAIIAHGAAFDQRFVPAGVGAGKPWICSMDDLEWPRARKPGESLVGLALSHGLGVAHAHRALADVDLLARLLTRAHELGLDLNAFLARGLRPKARFQALVSFERKDEAKERGFTWDPTTKRWLRTMAIEDVGALPFQVREVVP